MTGMLNWKVGGVLLGLVFLLAFAVVKPIGVSTQFVIADGILWSAIDKNLVTEDSSAKSGYKSTNSYLNKSHGKYAKSVAKPINYSYIFVFGMILGGFLSMITKGPKVDCQSRCYPQIWRDNFGDSKVKRFVAALIGGIIVLFGARLAGGCTSGHMMSGMMQTSVSGYIFAVGALAAAIVTAKLLYRK